MSEDTSVGPTKRKRNRVSPARPSWGTAHGSLSGECLH